MKIVRHLLSYLSLVALLLVGCSVSGKTTAKDSGNKETYVNKKVQIGSFSKIDAATGITVVYTQGKATGVAQISVPKEAEPYLKVKVINNVLTVRYERNNKSIKGSTTVTVVSPELQSVDLSSAASLEVKGDIDANRLNIALSSAGRAKFNNIVATRLDVDLSSSGNLQVASANLDVLEAELSSASSMTIEKVLATSSDLEVSSAAKITVNYLKGNKLETESSSGGSIYVGGLDMKFIEADASSGSKIVLSGSCQSISTEASSGARVDKSKLSVGKNSSQKSGNHASLFKP